MNHHHLQATKPLTRWSLAGATSSTVATDWQLASSSWDVENLRSAAHRGGVLKRLTRWLFFEIGLGMRRQRKDEIGRWIVGCWSVYSIEHILVETCDPEGMATVTDVVGRYDTTT